MSARNQLTPAGILAAARFQACRLMPYFTKAIYMLIPHEQPGFGTLGVTSRAVLHWDPNIVVEWGVEQTAGVLLHEVSHLLRRHHERSDRVALTRNDFDHRLANVCQDFEINDDLAQVTNVKLPGGGLQPEQHDLAPGKLWEEYYAEISRRKKDQPQPQGGQHPGQGSCGSCAHGGDGEDGGRTPDGEGRSRVEVKRVQREVARAVQEHVEKHGRGSVPGGWQVWADTVNEPPKVDWRDRLALDITDGADRVRGYVEYAFDRPSRRQLARGFRPGEPILPRLYAPSTKATVVFDTSGSMMGEPVRLGVVEVLGVLDALGAEARFVAVDAQVHEDVQVESVEDVLAALKGGGGTDFRPAFRHVLTDHEPTLIVMITDGYGPMPTSLPEGVELIGVLCGANTRVPWGADDEGGWSGEAVTYGSWIRVDAHDARDVDAGAQDDDA